MQWENDFSLKLRIKITKVTKEHLKKEKLQKIKKGKLFRTVSFYYLLKNLKNNIAFVTLWFKIKPMKPHVSARFINSVNCILIITLSNYHIIKLNLLILNFFHNFRIQKGRSIAEIRKITFRNFTQNTAHYFSGTRFW